MASRRMIPTRFFKDPDIMALSSKDTQLILIGLVLAADDEGREVAHAGFLGREMDYPPEVIERALQELEANDLLLLYQAGKHRYYFVTRWNEWQTLGTKKRPSKYPAPPIPDTTDEDRQREKPDGANQTDHASQTEEDASALPAFSGTCQHFLSQEKQRESNRTEDQTQGNLTQEEMRPCNQQKVILFPTHSPRTPALPEAPSTPPTSTNVLVQQVAQILKLEVSEALTRLVMEYARCSTLSLLGEADAAREWIDDRTRNRSGKSLTVAFFRRWLQREQQTITRRRITQEQQTTQWLAATGTAGAEELASPLPVREGRGRLPSLMHLADLDQQACGGR